MTGINTLLLSATRLHCKPGWLRAAPGAWLKVQLRRRPLPAAWSAGTWLREVKRVCLSLSLRAVQQNPLNKSVPHYYYYFIIIKLSIPVSILVFWSISTFFFPGKRSIHSCREPEAFHSPVPSCLHLWPLCRYRHQAPTVCRRWVYAVWKGVGWHSLGIMYFYRGSLATQLAE